MPEQHYTACTKTQDISNPCPIHSDPIRGEETDFLHQLPRMTPRTRNAHASEALDCSALAKEGEIQM